MTPTYHCPLSFAIRNTKSEICDPLHAFSKMQVLLKLLKVVIRNHRTIVSYLGFRSLRIFGQVYCNQGGTSRKLLGSTTTRRPTTVEL